VNIIERHGADTKRLKQETGSFLKGLRDAIDRSAVSCGRS
jgi:hypothetical protein